MMKNIRTADIIYVTVQLILFIVFCFDPLHRQFLLPVVVHYFFLFAAAIGLIIIIVAVLQLNTNLTPFPSPKASATLVEQGLYKYVRHPIYTGIIVLAFGYALYAGSVWKCIIAVALLLLFYLKSNYEEGMLLEKYEAYKNYRLKTGRFFPLIFR